MFLKWSEKSTRSDGWVLREMNQAGTDFTERIIQYHSGTPRHFGDAPIGKFHQAMEHLEYH